MRTAALLASALAYLLAVQGFHISPRRISTSSIISEETVATSFTEVTETYSYISDYFSSYSQSIRAATTFEECFTILTDLQTQISNALTSISGGCDCSTENVDTTYLQTKISTWFSQFETIAQYVQNRYPFRYQTFQPTFVQISSHIQRALGVAYSAGLDIDHLVQNAVVTSRVNQQVFSNLNININVYTHVSQQVEHSSGVFETNLMAGTRYPGRFPPGFRRGHRHKKARVLTHSNFTNSLNNPNLVQPPAKVSPPKNMPPFPTDPLTPGSIKHPFPSDPPSPGEVKHQLPTYPYGHDDRKHSSPTDLFPNLSKHNPPPKHFEHKPIDSTIHQSPLPGSPSHAGGLNNQQPTSPHSADSNTVQSSKNGEHTVGNGAGQGHKGPPPRA